MFKENLVKFFESRMFIELFYMVSTIAILSACVYFFGLTGDQLIICVTAMIVTKIFQLSNDIRELKNKKS